MGLGSIEQRTEGMKKQANELIEQAYQRGYKAWYEEGKGQTWSEEVKKYEIEPEKALKYIEQGRNEAWEAAKKLSDSKSVNEILDDTIFYCVNIFERHTASEAIEKLRAYEAQKEVEEIHVGDVIREDDVEAVVTWCDGKDWNGFLLKGENVGEVGQVYSCMSCNGWKKTGRTFPEIVEVLKKMQEGE